MWSCRQWAPKASKEWTGSRESDGRIPKPGVKSPGPFEKVSQNHNYISHCVSYTFPLSRDSNHHRNTADPGLRFG
jgi:hypothetical protein